MSLVALPDAARLYWRQQQQVNAAAVAVAIRSWTTSRGNTIRWSSLLPLVLATITRAQRTAADLAADYVDAVLRDLSIDVDPLANIDATPLIGVSGLGLPLQDLYAALPEQLEVNAFAIAARQGGIDVTSPTVTHPAMEATTRQLAASVQTVISDTGRAAESLHIAVRPGIGYVRMLNPPSCSRCVVLAGKFYGWNSDFLRHPRCDCRHVPAAESVADDIRVHPNRYFDFLTPQAQDAAFGKAGAAAIRDGADMSQVVNASQGMRVAQVYGRNLAITTQGVTSRGAAGRAIRARGRSPATTPRLMPSSIYQIADDRDDAIRLLRMNGYILGADTPTPPSPRIDSPSATPPLPAADASPTASGPTGPPRTPPPAPPAGADDDEPEGWSGHTKGYVHPHRTPVWTEAERVRRQATLGDIVPKGEQLYQHEIEAVERLLAAGQRLVWIARDTRGYRPTNDIDWTTRRRPAELKSTRPLYALVSQLIRKTVQRASASGFVKDAFIVDLGPSRLTSKLRSQLSKYNQRNPNNTIAELWVIARGELKRVDLA